jgi:integrase
MPAEVAAVLPGASWTARAIDGQAPAGELGNAASLDRAGGFVPRTETSRAALRLAVRASVRPRQRKSDRAVTWEVLDRLLATCRSDRLVDTRDLAILLLAFASGGRRRSGMARLRVEQISDEPAAPLDPKDPHSPNLPCAAIQLGRTKTGAADEAGRVRLVGPPAKALREWLERADISTGPIFHAIDRWAMGEERALTLQLQSINVIVKRRCAMAALEATGVFGSWAALGIFDGGRASRRDAAGGDAAVPAPVGAAGGKRV